MRDPFAFERHRVANLIGSLASLCQLEPALRAGYTQPVDLKRCFGLAFWHDDRIDRCGWQQNRRRLGG